jgi:hypothetical protein
MAIWHRQSPASPARTSRKARRAARKIAGLNLPLRKARIEQFEQRNMFVSPQLVSIIPNAGDLLNLTGTDVRDEAFRELTFRFDEGQSIDELSARNGGIQITRSGGDGVFGNGNDIDVTPNAVLKNGFIGIGDRPNEVVVRFSEHLPDDLYQIRIVGAGAVPLRNELLEPFNNGQDRTVNFELDLGPQVIAVVPQPIRRVGGQLQQARNEIEVYFNSDDLNVTAAVNPEFYQLIRTRRTADNLDDGAAIRPTSVVYDAAANRVRLIFGSDIAALDSAESVYRLRLGNRYNEPLAPVALSPAQDVNDTFATALDVNLQTGVAALDTRSVIISGGIDPVPYGLILPGGLDEPGHRDIPDTVEAPHVGGSDTEDGIGTIFYNFRDDYGTDPQGNLLHNLITEAQKQRAREVFAYYNRYLGVQFVETPLAGLTVVTGDLRALDPTVPTGPGGVIGLGGPTMVIMDNAENWNSDPGGSWFNTAMHEIGHALGLGHTYDLPPGTIMGDDPNQGGGNDPSFPGDNDILHGRHVHRPESIDIDLYKFRVDQAGVFSAETVAERTGDSSLLDSVIWVYNAGGELIARNDDYFSEDSFVELELQPGDYFVAVTSTGMSELNPTIAASAFGGTTQGDYELRLNFRASPERSPTAQSGLVDVDGRPTLLDGDADGRPGGDYNFWFTVASPANTFMVDKAAPAGGNGSLATPYNNIQTAFAAATARNSDGVIANDVRVVRIVGNGGADGNVGTLADNLAYEIGFNTLGQALSDGPEMQVPKGVTVMVDAGAIFKLRRANIDVGSKSQGVDRSEGHFQVLGTPTTSVIFTSYHSETVGRDTFALPTTPVPGDWGGIVYRNELDYDQGRSVLENEGIFINYVNHASFSFGGGDVLVDGIQNSFSPISLNEARPSLSFNTIVSSAGAGIAADPNSFKEDLFSEVGRDFAEGRITIASGVVTLTGAVWPAWADRGALKILGVPFEVDSRLSNTQLRLVDTSINVVLPIDAVLSPSDFTADYRRIGPEIYFNTLQDNSVNGLFIQIDTQAGQILDRLEVAARFNDTDITHVLSENLIIQGTPGGPEITIFSVARLEARLDGRLAIDPGIVVKADRARIETEIGAQLIAEGRANNRVVFTSLLDDRFGGSGTFDTAGEDLGPFSLGTVSAINGVVTLVGGIWPTWAAGATLTVNNISYTVESRDSDTQVTLVQRTANFGPSAFVLTKIITAAPGDWAGLYFGPLSQGSVDHALITMGGGTTRVEGGFASFNAVEIQQADVRLTNSVLEDNASGRGAGRGTGRFDNDFATIYVRGAQPIIVNNVIKDNSPGDDAGAISINVNALNSDSVLDLGRSTGALERTGDFLGNFGPLVRNNRLGGNGINGMRVRGSTVTTQSIWDDTDIVHVLLDEVRVQNHHTFSGVRLQSSPTESLVVKLRGIDAGLTANGVPLDIDDRIGGTVQVIGTPGHPVVMTSWGDSTVGAGLDPDGNPQQETFAGFKAPLSTVSQFDIQFRMSPQQLANPALVAALNLAASTWEAVLDDPITVVVDVRFGVLGGPVGFGTPVVEARDYNEIRQLMINDAGPNETIVNQLPTFQQFQATLPDASFVVSPTMVVNRANLLALGLDPTQVASPPSQFDPLTPIDGTLDFDSNITYDFDLSDGITPGSVDFLSVAAHEIGHVLGFISAVDDVDAGNRNINLNTLDLFRLAPGAGAVDFTNSPRMLNPQAPDHVFYDGGVFQRADITIPPRTVGDIPMSRGQSTDGFQASHWKDESQLGANSPEIGIMDPAGIAGVRSPTTVADTRAFDLIGFDAVSRGAPADWRSVRLERYSNDRNVATVTERETGSSPNGTPQTAQPLGELAPEEGFDFRNARVGGGDDNRRLGFEVHGKLNANSDLDVYQFTGTAGSEVWIDIDRTTHSLDSIIELVDADGNVIARSNDSHLEQQDPSLLFARDPGLQIFPLAREIFYTHDLYTTNPRDAGFRIILPGPSGTLQNYYVRVRSNSDDLSNVQGGETRGAYQFQVRLRVFDEIPGSTVRDADIRYATNGVELLGMPAHSPLLGESAESPNPNDLQPDAQDLGNLLVQERGAMGISGSLSTRDDVDWYKVVVDWAGIQEIPPPPGTPIDDDTASIIFDMDYADGAGRPDTHLSIFDEQGRLLYVSQASNVTDDQVAPASGGGVNDLGRGSFGQFDPYVGPLHLPENTNKTYYVAVSSFYRLPEVISTTPAVRREPISHIRRVIDDRVGSQWVPPVVPADTPPYQPGTFFDPIQIDTYPDPWQLNDVTLYVIGGGQLVTVDPFTGTLDSFVGLTPGIQPQNFGYGDIGMRLDGRLFAYTLGNDDGNSGNYHELDWHGPAFGANPLDVPVNNINDDGIVPSVNLMGTNQGVQIEAMAFQGIGQGSTLWVVGSVGMPNFNYLWAMDQTTGVARPDMVQMQVDPGEPAPLGSAPPDLMAMPPNVPPLDTLANGGPGGVITGMAILGGTFYFVSDMGGFYKREAGMFEFITLVEDDAGDPIPFTGLTLGPPRAEGGAYAEIMFATDRDGNLYALNDMGELQSIFPDSATSVSTGVTDAKGLAFSTLDYNLWHVTNRRANDAGHGLDPTPDRVRTRRTAGGSSFYFGLERNAGQPGATNYDSNNTVFNTYDLPGGAHGSLTTNTFSLEGYSFGDTPVLYFNYFASHDTLVDSFRVFISNDGAIWDFLGQTPLPPSPPFPVDDNGFPENMQNANDWRQARFDISPYFGQDNLRIRFEFSTEGGRRQTAPDVGQPLGALPGGELQDGDTFFLDALAFEFDMGFSLVVPNGAVTAIADGETFTLNDGSGPVRFEFDRDNSVTQGNIRINLSPTDSADIILRSIETAIRGMGPPNITPHIFQNRINLEGATTVTQSNNPALQLVGDAPGRVAPGAFPIVIHAGMTAPEVAIAMGEGIDAGFATTAMNTDDPNVFSSVKVIKDFVQVFGHAIPDPGPLPYSPAFAPDFMGDPDPGAQNINEDAKDNNFEGILLDDFMIGFVERGEMVLNTPVNTTFEQPNVFPADKILSGAYQLEARRGTHYGIALPPAPMPTDPPGFLLNRTFDTNHRFGDSIVLIAPEPQDIKAGATFTVGGGVNRLTFEFDLTGQGVTPGRRAVLVAGARTAADVAAAIANAINAVVPPAPNQPDPLTVTASVSPPVLNHLLQFEFHSPFVQLHRVAIFETDPEQSGIIVDTMDIGAQGGTVNEGTSINEEFGDSNIYRDQGQVLIEANSIRNSAQFGIRVDAGMRDAVTNLPHPGAVRNLQDFNNQRLAYGPAIINNLISFNGAGGILFSGDPGTAPPGAVPFGRIVNNTIFGGVSPTGVGILVNESASPTLLNNVLASLRTGVEVDASSASTIIGGTVFHRNSMNNVGTGLGTFPIVVGAGEELFVEPENGNFYPAPGSRLIDSSIDSLQDRPELTTLMNPLGFGPSPIKAPDRDQLGQLRINDPAVPSPPGLGADVFKDRGAVDRSDFSGPSAALIDPVTNTRLDPTITTLPVLQTAPVLEFAVQLIDGVQPADPAFGSGIDDRTIVEEFVILDQLTGVRLPRMPVTLLRDGIALVEGLDYILSYDPTNDVLHLRPAQGVWETGHTYVIRLDNTPVTGIRDLAANTLKANNLAGTTEFVITIEPVDFGDAPAQYPTLFADGGAHHRIVTGRQLGLTVTAETDGQPSQSALTDMGDDGVLIAGGLVVGETQQITVSASIAGFLDAWVDFNRDGDWNDAGEQIFASRSLVAGANNLTINVPTIAAIGESYARFRFSTAGGLSPTGPADDGEVEDYRVDIQSLVSYTLDLKYTNNTELFRDLLNRYFVAPGLDVIAEVYVDDNRSAGASGVRQAFADLVYDNDLIDFDPASLEFGPTFTSGRTGTVDEANRTVDEAGGIASVQPPNANRQLLFRVRGTVKQNAQADQTFTMSLNPADDLPAHATLLFNNALPIQASYDSETIVVEAAAWQNAASPLDVNADNFITGLDALVIINRLNLKGPAVLPPPGQPIPGDVPPVPVFPRPFYDVNGDGVVTALDALQVINALNAGQAGPVIRAVGEDSTATSTIVTAPLLSAASTEAGVPLASSFDVTPLAISVAASGSTAVAPALEAVAATRTAAHSTAIVDWFSANDDDEAGVRTHQSQPAVDVLAEALAVDERWTNGSAVVDDPTTFTVSRKSLRGELATMLEALGLDAMRKKKKAL